MLDESIPAFRTQNLLGGGGASLDAGGMEEPVTGTAAQVFTGRTVTGPAGAHHPAGQRVKAGLAQPQVDWPAAYHLRIPGTRGMMLAAARAATADITSHDSSLYLWRAHAHSATR